MIKEIVDILQKMESACPLVCSPQLRTSCIGNLVLEWRWEYKERPMMYSREITPECDDAMIDVIDRCIHQAAEEIAHKMGVTYTYTGTGMMFTTNN